MAPVRGGEGANGNIKLVLALAAALLGGGAVGYGGGSNAYGERLAVVEVEIKQLKETVQRIDGKLDHIMRYVRREEGKND